MNSKWLVPALIVLGLAACSSAPPKSRSAGHGASSGSVVQGKGGRPSHCPEGSPPAKAQEDPATRGNYRAGGLYRPGVKDTTPDYVPDVACIPEPLVSDEPRSAVGNRSPYVVLGKEYRVMERVDDYVEQGTASYYGAKFHGRLTSNREVYDMYQFTAAHKTLPLPSFARVTNLDNGESVIVRVNDRGPFHDGRVIDLSYAAAVRLGITQRALMHTLKSLERDGLAERLPDALDATLVRYELTDRGRSLLPLLTGLTRWASDNRVGILETRAAFDRAQAERAALLPRELTRPR